MADNGESSRYAVITEEEIAQLNRSVIPDATRKKAEWAMKIFKDWHNKKFKNNPLDRSPIRLYKLYVSLRPEPCTTSAFYLKPKDRFEGKNWFANAPVGRNTLFSMTKNMMESARVHGRYTNHSCRKTTGTRMHSAGFSENEIRSITGHSSNAVSEYIEIGEKRKIEISRSLSCSKISPVVKDDSNVKKTEGETEKKMPCVRMTKGDITLDLLISFKGKFVSKKNLFLRKKSVSKLTPVDFLPGNYQVISR